MRAELALIVATLLALPLCAAETPGTTETPDAVEILKRCLDRDRANESRLRDYNYTEVEVTNTLGKSGAVVKSESKTYDVLNLYGRHYRRLVARDGTVLEGKAKQKADEEFDNEVRKRERESPEEREKQAAEREKGRAESRKFLDEIPRAYNLKVVGEETIDDVPVWVIEGTPRPDFHSSVRRSDLLKKMRGRIWVDKSANQFVRAEIDLLEPISFGGFLAKLDRGAQLSFRQTRINGEVWLPAKAAAHAEGRLLMKHLSIASESTWSNYRKFQVDSKITPGEEASPVSQ